VIDGPCTACHDPHASDHAGQLKGGPRALCLGCHNQLAAAIGNAQYVHGAIDEPASCSHCHDGHGTDSPRLLLQGQREECLSCHDRALQTAQGEELKNMAALLAENPDQHGPVRDGDCSACHDPHAGNNFRLLAEKYPADFYAPFAIETYALCFSCHLKEMVLVPFGEGLTGFSRQTANGPENLHYLHVNKPEKGRTCRACHEVHASRRPAHIRESVPFGANDWPLEINFTKLEDGGRCSPGCHKEQEYHRPVRSPGIGENTNAP
jgi:predicted CXXCH cytochrome family protein